MSDEPDAAAFIYRVRSEWWGSYDPRPSLDEAIVRALVGHAVVDSPDVPQIVKLEGGMYVPDAVLGGVKFVPYPLDSDLAAHVRLVPVSPDQGETG